MQIFKKKDFKTRVFRASQKDAKSLKMYQLVTKMPFWAYAVGQVGKDFAAFVAISLFPLYMNRLGCLLEVSNWY